MKPISIVWTDEKQQLVPNILLWTLYFLDIYFHTQNMLWIYL